MHVLLIGSGGREDALAWALSRSPRLTRLDVAPGNAGTARRARNLPIAADDVDALVAHARDAGVDLVVVGPEVPLAAGIADRLAEHDIPCFGPVGAAARIEASKAWSKAFMERHGIPTAASGTFEDAASAEAWIRARGDRPCVVKADGLAAGKGVIMAPDPETAVAAVRSMLVDDAFGDAGQQIVVEETLVGREASFFALTDGERIVELATCQDYKRAEDGDLGPNTGGMGSYSPSVFLDEAMRRRLMDEIVRPTVRGLAADGHPYRGVLYTGVMLTDDGPRVLEFNARFGDPETQALLPRLDEDWLPLLHACAVGDLAERPLRWRDEASVCVVMTAGGYPAGYERGHAIEGVDDAERADGVEVFHAGTALDDDGRLTSAGGRVLGVTATAGGLDAARRLAYDAVDRIRWTDERHRHDIAADAVGRTEDGR